MGDARPINIEVGACSGYAVSELVRRAMSTYLLDKNLYFADSDAEFRRRVRVNAEEEVRNFPSEGDELKALVTGNVGSKFTLDTGRGIRPP